MKFELKKNKCNFKIDNMKRNDHTDDKIDNRSSDKNKAVAIIMPK